MKYTNRQGGGFSFFGALIGAAVFVATAVIGVPVVGLLSVPEAAIIGGVAGGLLGGSSDKQGAAAGGAAPAGEEPPAEDPNEPVDCSAVEQEYSALQQAYEQSKAGFQQAQQNLNNAGKGISSQSSDFNTINQACFPESPGVATACGLKNKQGCDAVQNQCNNLSALIDSTNKATCQLQTTALKLLPGGTASTTANPSANVFTVGVTPASIAAGGTIALATTISISNIAANAIKSFSIDVLDQNGTSVGVLASNTKIALGTTTKQISLQYNFKIVSTITPGAYSVRIYNDANTAENAKATLTITGATSTTTTTNNQNAFSNIVLNPSSIYAGGSFALSANVNSSSVQSYTVTAYKNGQNLGNMATNVPVGTTVRPSTVNQTFKTDTGIPAGSYSIQVADAANLNTYQTALLTVIAPSSFGQSVFTGTSGAAGTYVNANGTSNVATGGVTGSGNICTSNTDLKLGSRDATTGGQVSLLQSFLLSKGFFSYQITGYYGPITQTAVKAYQAANGVNSTGYFGPLSRAAVQRGAPCR